MSNRERVLDLKKMPKDTSMDEIIRELPSFPNSIWERPCRGNSIAPRGAKDEIIRELAYFAGISEALAQSERGEGVPVKEARRLLKS